jgi:hypothetical protein
MRERLRPWLARLSFVLAFAAVAVIVAFAEWKSLVMFAIGLVAAAVSVTSAFFVLSRRGVLRWLALAVFALTPVAVLVIYALAGLLWLAAVAAGCSAWWPSPWAVPGRRSTCCAAATRKACGC